MDQPMLADASNAMCYYSCHVCSISKSAILSLNDKYIIALSCILYVRMHMHAQTRVQFQALIVVAVVSI